MSSDQSLIMNDTNFPHPYRIRYSKKAKRINIKVCPQKGLELVLPVNANKEKALAFLYEKRDWVLRHQALLQNTTKPIQLPTKIILRSLECDFCIRYESVAGYRRIKIVTLPHEIVLYGPIENETLCFDALTNWVRIQAEKYLLKWLQQKSQSCGLPYNKLMVRGQNTRWGSCTHQKNISLNYKLMFLPYNLVEYVIVHELCHTVHLNHSNAFWALVAKYCPAYQDARNALRRVNEYMPDWV